MNNVEMVKYKKIVVNKLPFGNQALVVSLQYIDIKSPGGK
jgi:hypothetical protein